MNDVELLFCVHRADPRIAELVAQLSWRVRPAPPRELRLTKLAELRDVTRAELAGAGARWTPFYDQALHAILDADEGLLEEPLWFDETGPYDHAAVRRVHDGLDRHARMVDLLVDAERRGARMLSEAFDRCSISTGQVRDWFEMSRDLDALVQRVRTACERYLAKTTGTTGELARRDRELVRIIQDAHMQLFWAELARAPLELFVEIGNPFDPRTR